MFNALISQNVAWLLMIQSALTRQDELVCGNAATPINNGVFE